MKVIVSEQMVGKFVSVAFLFFSILSLGCSDSESGRAGGLASADHGCAGDCANQNLTVADVETILKQAVASALTLARPATIAILDRMGNVLALYQMTDAPTSTLIDSGISSQGGLEQQSVPSVLAAISKAGTGAYLSSQGQAFSTRTASQIIQEHFNPGERNTPGGPLFGVQFSQLPCSDLTVRNPTFADMRSSGGKWAYTGYLGPRFLPLGLSADPGGFPLYKQGDLVGGIGIELDGTYRVDRDILNRDDDIEERLALMASRGFEAPSKRVAPNVNIGKSLRYSDLSYEQINSVSISEIVLDTSRFVTLNEFSNASIATIRAGTSYGTAESGVLKTTRVGQPAAILVRDDGSPRYPTRAGTVLPNGQELSVIEVDALLDSAFLTALRSRAAIRRPLSSYAQVSIWIVDSAGVPLGFVRTVDAPLFGIDVALQKARSAVFFSSADTASSLSTAGFGTYVTQAQALLGATAFTGEIAFTARAAGNLSRPFFADGIIGTTHGPFSLSFPGSAAETWSPFNTGLQYDLVETNLFKALGLISSSTFPESCIEGALAPRLASGIQIFPGAVPLYRGATLVGAIGISGDGIDQDDLIAFYGASREGLNYAGHHTIGDSVLGFQAPKLMRSDRVTIDAKGLRLRYVNCPESPFLGTTRQRVCEGL